MGKKTYGIGDILEERELAGIILAET